MTWTEEDSREMAAGHPAWTPEEEDAMNIAVQATKCRDEKVAGLLNSIRPQLRELCPPDGHLSWYIDRNVFSIM